MTGDLGSHLEDYLKMRRALGFKLRFPGQVLPQFLAYLQAAGASTITTELAIAWAGLPAGVAPISLSHRLGAVRGFARYLAAIDPANEVPPCGIWPTVSPRPTPHLWSDLEVRALLDAAGRLAPALRALTHQTLFGLLASCGMRVGEALALGRDDVDLAAGVIMIGQAKLDRPRLVPLHPSTTAALRSYAEHRDRLCPKPASATFFVSSVGTALSYGGVRVTFVDLTTALGLRTAAAHS